MQSTSDPDEKPLPKQLTQLRTLAEQRGETFAWPKTRAQAAAQIEQMRGRPASSRSERAIERRGISRDMATRGGATAVRESEIVGYGSSAHWAVGQ